MTPGFAIGCNVQTADTASSIRLIRAVTKPAAKPTTESLVDGPKQAQIITNRDCLETFSPDSAIERQRRRRRVICFCEFIVTNARRNGQVARRSTIIGGEYLVTVHKIWAMWRDRSLV